MARMAAICPIKSRFFSSRTPPSGVAASNAASAAWSISSTLLTGWPIIVNAEAYVTNNEGRHSVLPLVMTPANA